VVAARKYYKDRKETCAANANDELARWSFYVLTVVEERCRSHFDEISVTCRSSKTPAPKSAREIITNTPTRRSGRIAPQTAKQVILKKVREAESDTLFKNHHGRVTANLKRHRKARRRPGT